MSIWTCTRGAGAVAMTWTMAMGGPVELPGGDTCDQAVLVGEGVYTGDTTSAGVDGNATCAESSFSPDLFYMIVPAKDATLRLSLCGSGFDTMLSVHTACPADGSTQIACSDDYDCDGDGGLQDDGWVSQLDVAVTGGVEYIVRVSGWNGDRGAYVLDVSYAPPPPEPTEGADILIGEISQLIQAGRVGDIIGCVSDTPVCNAGSEPLDWFPLEDGRHPFMSWGMYRLENGRLMQIGISSIKHGIASDQSNACGLGCQPYPNSTRTGPGCSDTYSAGFNTIQDFFGPRSEIEPWQPSFTYAGSYFDTFNGSHNGIDHRLQIHDADLDPAQHPDAQYFLELYILSHDDVDHLNSIAHEPVLVSGAPGGTWSFGVGAQASELGPAIIAWEGATVSMVPDNPVDDGRAYVASKATALGMGRWLYEYAVFNLDMTRGVGAFSLPVPMDADVSGVGFHGVETHNDVFSNDPWAWTHEGGVLRWETTAHGVDPQANPIRWGMTHTFWFEAGVTPGDATLALAPYFPGAGPSVVTAGGVGPAGCVADLAEPYGSLDFADVVAFLSAFSTMQASADLAEPFNEWNFSDVVAFLVAFGSGCP